MGARGMNTFPPNSETIKVIFRKTPDGAIFALLPELVSGDSSCICYEYIDKDTPIHHISFIRYLSQQLAEMGPLYQEELSWLGDLNELGVVGKLIKRSVDIPPFKTQTTKATPREYIKLKNKLEEHGFYVEVQDDFEVTDQPHNVAYENHKDTTKGPTQQIEFAWKNVLVGFLVVIILLAASIFTIGVPLMLILLIAAGVIWLFNVIGKSMK